MRSFFSSLFCLGMVCFSLFHSATAQTPLPKPPGVPMGSQLIPAPKWINLTEAERAALAPLSSKFDSLDNAQRRKWLVVASRFPQWTIDKQKLIQSRMLAWASMTSEQRAAARQQALAARLAGSTSAQRAQNWQQWHDMEDDDREKLHEKAVQSISSPH